MHQPRCAICHAPPYPECPCESERLQIAVQQAETRAMDARLAEIRDWVISHARQHINEAFERLAAARNQAHAAYLASLPYYSVYAQYAGRPPLHPAHLAQLQAQLADAHAELERGIDADWRTSVLRYPEVLDYFYSLVALRLPSERSPSVAEPPFAAAGHADRGYASPVAEAKKKKKKKKKRSDGEPSAPPGRRKSHDHAIGHMRNPPPVPTPPMHGYPAPGAYHGYQ